MAMLAALFGGFVVLSWRIIEITAARSLVNSGDPAVALEWDHLNAAALDAVAERSIILGQGTSVDGRGLAMRAVALAPLDDRALALIALDADRKGEHAKARQLMQVAGSRSWRYPVAQAWLFSANIAEKRYTQALPHLDALLRVNEDSMDPLLPLAASFTSDDEARLAFSSYLAGSPPWRGPLLAFLSRKLRNRENLISLFDQLAATRSPPTDPETAGLLDRLIRDREYFLAKSVAERLRPDVGASSTSLFNGDFSKPLDGSPFNWRVTGAPGVEIRVMKSSHGSSQLSLQFAGRVPLNDVQQLLVLPPGTWGFSGQVRAEQLRSEIGVGWRVACAATGQQLNSPELETGSFAWKTFRTQLEVPSEGCPAQVLSLVHPSRVASEEYIRGDIFFRNLALQRQN